MIETQGVSIAICTYNRSEELTLTLHSLATALRDDPLLNEGSVAVELIVVDNCSNDQTPRVVNEVVATYPCPVRYVYEGRPGLTHARNRSIEEARYEIVAFLDDDVDVGSGWLTAVQGAYRTGDYAAVGGRAYLVYPSERPPWITDSEERSLSKVDYGPQARIATPHELFGLNFSFRKDWLLRVGLFPADLGRVGGCLLSGEDAEVLQRIANVGGVLWYEPGAVVGHRVPPERLTKEWFLRRHYWGVRTGIRMERRTRMESAAACIRGIPALLRLAGGLLFRKVRRGQSDAVVDTRRRWVAEGSAIVIENMRNAIHGNKEAVHGNEGRA